MRLFGTICVVAAAVAACSDDSDSDEFDPHPSCGDTLCDPNTCETELRCEVDCGTCTGAACTPPGDNLAGTCGEPCSDSCGCLQADQVCTADLGAPSGVCMPISCGLCEQGKHCDYSVDGNGRCTGGTCVPD